MLLSSSGWSPVDTNALQRPDLMPGWPSKLPRVVNMNQIGDALTHEGDATFGPKIEVAIARVRAEIARLHGELTRYGLVVWTGAMVGTYLLLGTGAAPWKWVCSGLGALVFFVAWIVDDGR